MRSAELAADQSVLEATGELDRAFIALQNPSGWDGNSGEMLALSTSQDTTRMTAATPPRLPST